jgi:hypothetical protein
LAQLLPASVAGWVTAQKFKGTLPLNSRQKISFTIFVDNSRINKDFYYLSTPQQFF